MTFFPPKDRVVALAAIGTGFGGTGTMSMKHVPDLLGVGAAHCMSQIVADEDLRLKWVGLAASAKPEWQVLFQGYTACTDRPSAAYWRDLIPDYPSGTTIKASMTEGQGGTSPPKSGRRSA